VTGSNLLRQLDSVCRIRMNSTDSGSARLRIPWAAALGRSTKFYISDGAFSVRPGDLRSGAISVSIALRSDNAEFKSKTRTWKVTLSESS
jgi:hypothetical protein